MNERINNPLTPINAKDNRFPDPHVKVFINPDTGKENMYIYVGHDESREHFVIRDWYVMWSEDLLHWQSKVALKREDTYLPADSTECWACDCVQSPWDGKYYLYYSCAGESTGVAVSERPDGPFVDARGKTPILPKGITPTNSYDPDIILPDEDDPHAYILFGSDWTDHYWAMQLAENMTEVVPGTARKVPVYPADGTATELLGPLRSDQAEVFRYRDIWYMYWAGRYATSTNRLGPYVFRDNIGKEIPQYPDGRCFIDHGSFVEWNGQWFYVVCRGTEVYCFRQTWLMYVHVCDDGTLMLDEAIRRCGVGQYCAEWERIEAEWYMIKESGLQKVELHAPDGSHAGFAVKQDMGTNRVCYPHVYGIPQGCDVKLCAKGHGTIAVQANGVNAGDVPIDTEAFMTHTLCFPCSGECDIAFVMQGEVTLDWFAFQR